MLGSVPHSQHAQHAQWGNSDGVAYIHTTPLLQGKPVSDPYLPGNHHPQSPFQAPSVQLQPAHIPADQLSHPQQHPQLQHQQSPSRHAQHQLPMIVEQVSGESISPTHTAQFSGSTPTTSSYSSPSASTAANTSSNDLRAFPDGSVEGPLQLPPMTPPHAMHGSTPFQGGQGSLDASSSQQVNGLDYKLGTGGLNKSRYRGVSYDKKKRKWRVQIKVATLGKSGVSVGYYDTEDNAARAYDRAAIGLLGRDNCSITTNFPLGDYDEEVVPQLIGKSREEVKTTLKNERAKVPRRRFSSRQRTSRYMGVGSSNRKNQWQARILVHGKVTHLGYYETEEDAAKVYDRVSISLHGEAAQTNFPPGDYQGQDSREYSGLDREDLQRALGVKPMDKSSKFRGVSKKKGKWEAKVMVNRKWAYRELFDSEEEAARAYDGAVWRLKPKEAKSYVNFKDRPGQGSSKLAKAARMIERAQAKERVGSSQNSPSSTRSLPPLPPAHEAIGDPIQGQSYPYQQQGVQPMRNFSAGIKLEPGTSFSPTLSRAAQSAAVANLGAAPPPAGSPGSLSRTSSSHALGSGGYTSMGPPAGHPPAWLTHPLSTPQSFSPHRIYQLEAIPNGRGTFSGQQPTMPPALMHQHSLGMSRTLSEADISNQSAMSALTGHHMTQLPPSASASRQNYQNQSSATGNPHWSPVSPPKLRASMSSQDLTCNPFKLQHFSSPLPSPFPPLHIQNRAQQQAQHAQQPPLSQQQHPLQQQQQQQQQGNMMVRVGSETHFIPESQAGYYGISRVPSAPFISLEQRSSHNSQYALLDSRMHAEAPPGQPHPQFGQWAPDSHQILGVKQQEPTDMQVDMPMTGQAYGDESPGMPQLPASYTPAQPSYQTPSSPQSYPQPQPQHLHPAQMPPSTLQQGYMSPPMQQQQSHMGHHMQSPMQTPMQTPMQSQAVPAYQGSQRLSQQQQHQQQQDQERQMLQHQHQHQHQQHLQQEHQRLYHHQQQQQQQMRQQPMQQQMPDQLQHQGPPAQQQGHGPGPGQGQGIPRSASVSHMGMQWQPVGAFNRSASASNLMMPAGHSWMSQSQGQNGEQVMGGLVPTPTGGKQFFHHSNQSMGQAPFDPNPQHGDGRGLESMGPGDGSHDQISSQDLLADLSASQLLAQADLAECNSPLKIVQIGGDDLFDDSEAAGNDFLLDAEGMP